MRQPVVLAVFLWLVAQPLGAQIAVHDPAVTAWNAVTAAVQQEVLATQRDQHSQLRRMAQRLSLFTNLAKYALPGAPAWRTHGTDALFALPYTEALTFGDPSGAGYLAVSHPLVNAAGLLGRLGPAARRAFTARLATVNLADAVAIAATHDTGQLRFAGRKQELPAIEALEAKVIDPSLEQSATAILDKISAAVLVGARQRQARSQLLAALVEQLLVESKRDRDADTAAMNLQLVTWRDGRAANNAFVAGTGDALRTWRQP